MAALTITSGSLREYTEGNRRVVKFELPAVSDADTVEVTALREGVDWAEVEHIGADAVAADSIVVASITKPRTIVFQVGGTARTARVTAYGLAANK